MQWTRTKGSLITFLHGTFDTVPVTERTVFLDWIHSSGGIRLHVGVRKAVICDLGSFTQAHHHNSQQQKTL